MTQSYRGLNASQLPNLGGIVLSFLTPEEIVEKKKTRKTLMYIGLFVFTIILIGGTTFLTYNL
jgi:hypothetical protein